MPEIYIVYGQNTLFCRHNPILEDRPSLLLIHGLGDSGLAFAEIFEDHHFDGFNIVAPDLLGYGRSSHSLAHNYSFDLQLDCLRKVIEHFGLAEITLVGHSMNAEGDLTEHDLSISGEAFKADKEGRFGERSRRVGAGVAAGGPIREATSTLRNEGPRVGVRPALSRSRAGTLF